MKTAIKLFILMSLLHAASAHALPMIMQKFDPAFTFTTLETPHFLIHYHQGEEELAQSAARIAEEEHARLVPRIKWEPKDKTHLVFVDKADFGMGQTSVAPYSNIIIYTGYPHGQGAFPGDWLRAVIVHEYTHVLQLDMVRGIPETIQNIFGRLYFPNMPLFQPTWMIEGLADYEYFDRMIGREHVNSDMMLRMAILEDRFPTLDRMSTYFVSAWPGFSTPYLYGESFIRFLVDIYGRDKVADISVDYSGRGFPFMVNSTGRRVLNKSYEELWREWKKSLQDRYSAQQKDLQAKGITPSTPLTNKGYVNTSAAFSPDGARIAYFDSNADEFPGIYLMNADGGNAHKLVDNAFADGGISWNSDGSGIYYPRLDFWRNTDQYNDLYYYDLNKGSEVRLTEGLRARDPNPSPDRTKLVFVMNSLSKTRLAMMNITPNMKLPVTEKELTFLNAESSHQYATPRFSPDGSKIAVSVATPDGFADIWILDAQGNKIDEIAHDRANDSDPAWGPTGKYIYFSSNRTGVANLYAYELETKIISRITNVLGGAFAPSPSPDGKALAFSSYSSRGYDIHRLALDASSLKPAEPYLDTYPIITSDRQAPEIATRPYSPLSTLYPRWWFPTIIASSEDGTLVGLSTSGQDVLKRHRYNVTALYGSRHNRPSYVLNYFYDGLYPTLHLKASDTDNIYSELFSDSTGTKDYVERDRSYDAAIIVPVIKTTRQYELTIGYRWRNTSHLTTLPTGTGYSGPVPAEGVFASGYLSFRFNNSKQFVTIQQIN